MTDLLFFSYWISEWLFCIGIYGILCNQGNVLRIFLATEILLFSINFNLIISSCLWNDVMGLIFTFFILTIAAAEISIGLALLVTLHTFHKALDIQLLRKLKG